MKIPRVILTKPVTIHERNIWGRKSCVTVAPSSNPTGWYFYNPVTKREIPIDKHSVQCGKNNLFIRNWRASMHTLEHLLSIRYFGLDGVCIYGSRWTPYLTAEECWNQIREEGALLQTGENIKTFPISDIYISDSSVKSKKRPGMTIIEPLNREAYTAGDFENIEISVYIDYPRIGKSLKLYNNPACFTSVLGTYPQGYPAHRYYVCKMLSWLGWPHFEKVVWFRRQGRSKTLEEFSYHRLSDILGILAMICHDALPTNFRFSSCCSGHSYDLNVVKKIK